MSIVRPVYMKQAEIISIKEAARRAKRTPRTIIEWCIKAGIGRQPGGKGPWQVSAPALEMFLANDEEAIELLRQNRRNDPRLASFFFPIGLVP